jgi:COP9 signalosome complex subunit 2
MLNYAKNAVTENYREKSITSILELISTAHDTNFMEKIYTFTLNILEESKNDRLWFKTNLKLAHLWLQLQQYQRIPKV